MTIPAEEFNTAITDMEEALRRAMRAFVASFVADFKVTPAKWRADYPGEPMPSAEYFIAFNAGVESAGVALDLFLDENLDR